MTTLPDYSRTFEAAPISWEAFKAEFLAFYVQPLRARATCSGMRYAVRCLDDLGVTSTADLTVPLIARLVASRPAANSPHSTRGLLAYCSVICTYAEKSGWLRISPFRLRAKSSWVRATPARGKKHASREDIRKVLDLMRDQAAAVGFKGWKAKRLFSLTATLAYTGMRAGEAQYLQTADVDLDEGVIWIVSRAEHRTKTIGSVLPIAMPPPLIPILSDWIKHNRMSRPPGFKVNPEDPWVFPTLRRTAKGPWVGGGPGSKPRDRMKAVAAQAGVMGFGPLVLRHSMATHLLHWGAGAGMVMRILRHTTERTAQQWYTHDDLPNLKAAVRNVEF